MRRLIAALCLCSATAAYAGAQLYEPLAASVQAALHKAVSDARPPTSSFRTSLEAADWLSEMSAQAGKADSKP